MQFWGLFGAVKSQHGEINEHNWDWNYPFWNQNFFSGTVCLNGAIVAFYLAPTVLIKCSLNCSQTFKNPLGTSEIIFNLMKIFITCSALGTTEIKYFRRRWRSPSETQENPALSGNIKTAAPDFVNPPENENSRPKYRLVVNYWMAQEWSINYSVYQSKVFCLKRINNSFLCLLQCNHTNTNKI